MKGILKRVLSKSGYEVRRKPYPVAETAETRLTLSGPLTVAMLVESSSQYIDSLKECSYGELKGYKFAHSCREVSLYGTISALLFKHLIGVEKEAVNEELSLLKKAQAETGLFFDAEMDTEMAAREDWWGWRHLSFLALMALGLYGEVPPYEVDLLPELSSESSVNHLVDACDWGTRVAYTSNRLQNFGVMLQFARDFQNSSKATHLIEYLLHKLSTRVDPKTGMFGVMPCIAPEQLSEHVQAAYHFWLLYDYDGVDIPYFDKAIDKVLQTQNVCGGFGVKWNSSCCEDIDSIDPLYRYIRSTGDNISCVRALEFGLTSILRSLNPDGGFVFRRDEALRYGDAPVTWAGLNESCLLFTWFRLLSLAYITQGLGRGLSPGDQSYKWTWRHAPGLQYL
jgi:hypothetical protein